MNPRKNGLFWREVRVVCRVVPADVRHHGFSAVVLLSRVSSLRGLWRGKPSAILLNISAW